ncbi:MAG: hypothetical protein AAFN77_11965 [Planctomycetota bacterium]
MSPESASQTKTTGNDAPQTQTNQPDPTRSDQILSKIEPGFYRPGTDYERVSSVLGKSDASIQLDYHSGIGWYDKSSNTRSTLNDINEVKPLLKSIKDKHLVVVSTGKTDWDKYDEHIAKVVEFAGELGFDMTIVTDDNAQGLVVSKVIEHKN